MAGPKSSTAAHIIEVAREMGYRLPATETSSLRRGSVSPDSAVLGLLLCMPDSRTPNSTEVLLRILHGATDAARERNQLLHVEYTSESAVERISSPSEVPAALKHKQISGVLVAGIVPEAAVAAIAQKKPCVRMNIHDISIQTDLVGQDDRTAVGALVTRLKELGHRRIGYCCQNPKHSFALSRFSGYVEALAQHDLPYDPAFSINIWERVDSRFFSKIVDAVADGVRAWICSHDDVGYELMAHFQQQGLRVPEDVSVCGFDNLHLHPGMAAMTTIDWPLEDMAASGISMLLQRINDPARAVAQLLFRGQLIPGETVGRVKSAV